MENAPVAVTVLVPTVCDATELLDESPPPPQPAVNSEIASIAAGNVRLRTDDRSIIESLINGAAY
jgi:hypothetical protein